MRLNNFLVLTLAFIVISGTSSMAFAQTTHSPDAITGGSTSGPIEGAPAGAFDTTASVNYCGGPNPGDQCHVDFQDPDGVGSTNAATDQLRNFPACPVGEFGMFPAGGAWSHPDIGDSTITATDCAGFTTCWELQSNAIDGIVQIACNAVGGDFVPIDTTAVLIAGAQTNAYTILGAFAAIGAIAFGALAISIKRKRN